MTSTKKLTQYKAIVFDVYGTLIDWETGIYNGLLPLLNRFSHSKKWSRVEAMKAYSSVETDLQARYPTMLYRELLAKVHEVLEARLIAAAGGDPPTSTLDGERPSAPGETSASGTNETPLDEHQLFADSIKTWPPFPDTVEALKTLSKYYRLTVLSNVDRDSFGYSHALLSTSSPVTTNSPNIYAYPEPKPDTYWFPKVVTDGQSPFSLILTAQDNGVYKPSLDAFHAALKVIKSSPHTDNAEKDEVLVVAQSLFHDHGPANKLGLSSVWIDRAGAVVGVGDVAQGISYDWRFATLGEFAAAVEEEAGK